MFDWLTKLIKKLLAFLKEFWAIILVVAIVVLAVFFPAVLLGLPALLGTMFTWLGTVAGGIATFFAGLGIEGAIAAAIGMAILVDPEGVGEGVAAVVEGIGNAGSSVLGTVLSSPIGMGAVALGALFLLSGNDDDSSGTVVLATPTPSPGDRFREGVEDA